jgi:hypothetical protein
MEKQNINLNVSEADLQHTLENILKLEYPYKLELQKIVELEQGISTIGHYMMTITNRAISINRAFVTLVNVNNYLTAISLIRLQIDNCLRLFAISLYPNPSEFYEKVLQGEHIRNLKDRDQKFMTDEYLVTKIDVIFPQFKMLYKKMSGHIHFSKEHFSFNSKIIDNTFSISVGDVDNLEIYKKVDYAFNMFLVGKDLLKIVSEYRTEINKVNISKI